MKEGEVEQNVRSTNAPKTLNKLRHFVIRHPILSIILLALVLLLIHPKLFNFRLQWLNSGEEPVPMNYVTNFHLWTRSNRVTPHNITVGLKDSVLSSYFRANSKTYIIIHGFTRSGMDSWIIRMKDALLNRQRCNVISVDWKAGALTAAYYVIRERVPATGKDVAALIGFLNSVTGTQARLVHIIGHSLGAHVAGFAGKDLNSTIGRITGLDPAGLMFSSASRDSRLDVADANFVDVIHTHGCYAILSQWTDCYGTHVNMGHADFWPNGGESQPPCGESGNAVDYVTEGSSCDHGVSYVYFIESISYPPSSTRFLSRKCDSWHDFNNGSCSCHDQPTQYMGFNADPKIPGVFYLNTSLTHPFALLEPNCPPAETSILKFIGLLLCVCVIALQGGGLLLQMAGSSCNRDFVQEIERCVQQQINTHLQWRTRKQNTA